MARIIKGRQMSARYWKGREVLKEYKLGRLVYEKQTSIPDYLCFTALEAGQFTLTIPAAVTATYLSYVEWSKDGRTWNHTDNTSEAVTIDVQVASGEKVYWRGSGICMTKQNANDDYNSLFSSDARFDVSGHIMSLLKGDNFMSFQHLDRRETNVVNVTFANLFARCNTIINAKDLVLPTFTNGYTYIFYRMFFDCSNLVSAPLLPNLITAQYCYSSMLRGTAITTAPELPATTLETSCYNSMFYDCPNLTTASALPATTLANNCYGFMYSICPMLEKNIPELPAPILVERCYDRMFQSSPKVNHIKCLATDISATYCVNAWLNGVSSTGTFIQASGATWPRGASGIPTGWVDVEKRTMPSGYKQLLWVSTDSKAYVNTGIAGDNDNLKITTVFNMSAYVDWGAIYGNYVGDSYNVTRLVQGSSDACSCCNLNVKSNNSGNQLNYDVFHINRPHMVIQSKNSVIYNGTTINISGKASGTANSGYIALGNRSMTNPNTTRNIGLCIYTHKIEDTSLSSVLCDYVACVRESDSKAGFYDFVSNAFIPSATSSDFTAGEEI